MQSNFFYALETLKKKKGIFIAVLILSLQIGFSVGACYTAWIGDGWCDKDCNTCAHGFDNGDCYGGCRMSWGIEFMPKLCISLTAQLCTHDLFCRFTKLQYHCKVSSRVKKRIVILLFTEIMPISHCHYIIGMCIYVVDS